MDLRGFVLCAMEVRQLEAEGTAYIGTFGHKLPGLMGVTTFNGRTVGHGSSRWRGNDGSGGSQFCG